MIDNSKRSKDFGRKEHVLNYACQTYQLSRPNKVGEVMALIRECQPASYEEWSKYYFKNAYATNKDHTKMDRQVLAELGDRLYEKITTIIIPEWEAAFAEITRKDCRDYIINLTLNRTYDGYIREKSVVNDGLAKIFPKVVFEESDPSLDHSMDIDYTGKVGSKYFGIQIKPITANSNFGGYSVPERMKKNFQNFESEFGGKVFIVFSLRGEIANKDVIGKIREEIKRLSSQSGKTQKSTSTKKR